MTVAYAALFGWPLVAMVFFKTLRFQTALISTFIFGYLFLPTLVEYDLPVLPTLNKQSIPAICALLGALLIGSNAASGGSRFVPNGAALRILLVTLAAGAFLTVLTNSDAIIAGPLFLPGLRTYDALSAILTTLTALIPFFIACKFMGNRDFQETFLKILVGSAVAYSFLALYEVRMSPQLNNMIYGFFPHSFIQHIRGDGFRPLVFLNHGLMLSLYLSFAIVAAATLLRKAPPENKNNYLLCIVWLFFTLVLSKSIGALLLTIVFLPLALFGSVKHHLMVAAAVATLAISYPILRASSVIPTDQITNYVQKYSPQRAQSLDVRFSNEDILLAKANQRPAFGWGGWGRSRVYNEWGKDISVTDGRWVILMGTSGWTGYLAEFGLLCLPLLLMLKNRRRYEFDGYTSALALILAINLIDMLPNASLSPLTWLISGALWGRLAMGAKAIDETESEQNGELGDAALASQSGYQYSRFRELHSRR